MLASEIISRARLIAGDSNSLQVTDAQILLWLDDAIKEIVISNQLCQKTATQNLVVGTDTYTLPADIFKLHSVLVNAEKIPVYSLQEWEARNAGYGAGASPIGNSQTLEAYVWAGNIVLYPPPDQTYQMKINYTYQPAALAAVGSTPDIPNTYHLRLVTYVLAQYALMDEDVNKYAALKQSFDAGVVDLRYQHEGEEDLYSFISVDPRDTGFDTYGGSISW